MVTKGRQNIPSPLDEENLAPSYYDSNLSLIARETMRLLFNHQLNSSPIQSKSISLEQICYYRSQCIRRQKTNTYNESRKVLPI